MGAVSIVRQLKAELEDILGESLDFANAATAIPPRFSKATRRSSRTSSTRQILTLPTSWTNRRRQRLFSESRNGAVVDVGGGTTGISILKDGEVVFTADRTDRGTHMSLVIAGNRVSFDEAEEIKIHDDQRVVFPIIKPVIEKMASGLSFTVLCRATMWIRYTS